MIRTGMVSVTFRQFDVDEVIRRTKEAGLMAIEWGGDVHVPHGDLDKARYTARRMRENGLEIASYGSYYRALEDEKFEDILATAKALGAPNIRIWAGEKEPQDCDGEQRAHTVQRIRDAARMAAKENITVSTEYHGGTLTVMQDSAIAMLKEAEEPNLFTYWQPLGDKPWKEHEGQVIELLGLGKLSNLHVYQWQKFERYPLEQGEARWETFLRPAAGDAAMHYALLEFVQDDDPEQFLRDAATLQAICKRLTR